MPGEIMPQTNLASSTELAKSQEAAVDRIFDAPVQKSATTLEFNTEEPGGLELRPDHVLEFEVPENMKGRVVRDVVLQHRKAEEHRVGTEKHDPSGAYSRVELHDTTTDQWVRWKDPAGYNSDKYAEWRSAGDPEYEVLHDWVATVGTIKPDKIRVTNVGKDPEMSISQIHQLDIVFFPELDNVELQEQIYTPGTEFIDIEKGKTLPRYGGGERTRGKYENAIRLNGYGQPNGFELCNDPGQGVEVSDGAVYIDLDPSKKLVQVEIAAGDTENLQGISDSSGKSMRLGWAKLWVGIQKADSGSVEWFISKANVPPQGVIAGGPELEHTMIQEGDKLVIESRDDATYIMGWRIAYEKAEAESEVKSQEKPKRKLNLHTLFRRYR